MGKNSTLRYKNAQKDVVSRLYYNMSVGDTTNPYDIEDRRHNIYAKRCRTYRECEELLEFMCDTSTLIKRKHKKPNPIVPYDDLHLHTFN